MIFFYKALKGDMILHPSLCPSNINNNRPDRKYFYALHLWKPMYYATIIIPYTMKRITVHALDRHSHLAKHKTVVVGHGVALAGPLHEELVVEVAYGLELVRQPLSAFLIVPLPVKTAQCSGGMQQGRTETVDKCLHFFGNVITLAAVLRPV